MKMVRNGIDVLDYQSLKNYRIGLVSNYSSVNSKGELLTDILLSKGLTLRKLFIPEHGLYLAADGMEISDFFHPKLGIPVISVYGTRDEVSCEMLEDVDLIMYDIQDVGLRYYTFIYALANMMKAAAKCGVKFLILDRFNLLGRKVFGPRMPEGINSIIGGYELPVQYGLTTGELALYYKKYLKLDIDLEIVRCENWNGEAFPETGIFWNVPSPNLPTFSSLLCYAGICFFEATNLSVGRGTTKPFEFLGAPWVDENDMYEYLKHRFPNLFCRKRQFIPQYREYAQNVCNGVEFFPKQDDNFFEIAVALFEYFEKYEEFKVDYQRLEVFTGVREFMKNKEKFLSFDLCSYLEYVEDLLLYN
jgi:uncharacterized protein YbbC (DUF1343 family)